MAIAVGTPVTAQDKTTGTSLALGTFGSVAVGDIIVVSFACDQTSGSYSIAHTGTASISWTNQGTQSKSGSEQHILFTGEVTAAGTCTAVTVTHPSLDARSMSGVKVTGGSVISGYSGQAVTTPDSAFKANGTTQWQSADWSVETLYIGGVAVEGPDGDTYSDASPCTVIGKIGTTGAADSSNITTALTYVLYSTAPPGNFDLGISGSQSRWWAGGGVQIEGWAGPTYAVAGTGAEGSGTPINVPYPASIAAGDLLVLHIGQATTSSASCDTPSGWTAHPDNPLITAGPGISAYAFWKIADGSETGNLSVTGLPTGTAKALRMYRLTGGNKVDSQGGAATSGAASTTVSDRAVSSIVASTLGINLVAVDNGEATVAFTGMTGATWTEQAEFADSGLNCTVQLQTAELNAVGTVDGGTFTLGVAAQSSVFGLRFYTQWSGGSDAEQVLQTVLINPCRLA